MQAHAVATDRRLQSCNARQVPQETWAEAQEMLRLDFSPEQVCGRLHLKAAMRISHETLYRRIYADKRAGGDLHTHLRCQKKRRKRCASGRSRRGLIPNRVSIDQRCPRVQQRATVGHWEGDTVIGKNHKGALVTLVERKSCYTQIRKVSRKTAAKVSVATIDALGPLRKAVKTITYDNGMEFADHLTVAVDLQAKTYFAHPYSS